MNSNNDLNFQDIVLGSLLEPHDGKDLESYFNRKASEAQKEKYSLDEFKSCCYNILDKLENEINKRYTQKREQYTFGLSIGNKENIEYYKNELETISKEDFPVNLIHFTNSRYTGFLRQSKIKEIKQAISNLKAITRNRKKTTEKAPVNTNQFEEKTNKSLKRLELFKTNDINGNPLLNDNDYELLKTELKKFILEDNYKYRKPSTKLNVAIHENAIRRLFYSINLDLFKKGKRADKEKKDFITFMIDYFKLPPTWERGSISKKYATRYSNIKFTSFLH